jgi:cytochrome c oxidase subunit 3
VEAIRKFRYWPNLPQLGMLAFLVSLTMFFGSLILSYVMVMPENAGLGIAVPPALWLSTVLIAASATALAAARWHIRRAHLQRYRHWLAFTIVLAIAFLASQFAACINLYRQGAFAPLAGMQSGNAFYIFTGFHGLHVFGGVGALAALLLSVRGWAVDAEEQALRRQRNRAGIVAMYWNFVAISWGVLFVFLLYWTRP